jgi:outer membrane protein TolC
VGASLGLSPASGGGVSAPVSVSLKVSWQALDSGLRDLTRQELVAQVELRRLALERARQDYASSLADLGLEAMSLENRTADAKRNIEAAGVSLDETRMLVEKGMKTERDLAKAQQAVQKRAIQLRLVALDRLAFRYRAKTLVLPL